MKGEILCSVCFLYAYIQSNISSASPILFYFSFLTIDCVFIYFLLRIVTCLLQVDRSGKNEITFGCK